METGSTRTASATTQSCVSGDFLAATEFRATGGLFRPRCCLRGDGWGLEGELAGLSLGLGIPFPGKTETGWRVTGSNVATTARSDRVRGIGATIQEEVRKGE